MRENVGSKILCRILKDPSPVLRLFYWHSPGKIQVYCCFYLHLTWSLYSICYSRLIPPWYYLNSCLTYTSLLVYLLLPPWILFGTNYPDLNLLTKLTMMVFYWSLASASLSSIWHVFLCLSHLFLWLQLRMNPSFICV